LSTCRFYAVCATCVCQSGVGTICCVASACNRVCTSFVSVICVYVYPNVRDYMHEGRFLYGWGFVRFLLRQSAYTLRIHVCICLCVRVRHDKWAGTARLPVATVHRVCVCLICWSSSAPCVCTSSHMWVVCDSGQMYIQACVNRGFNMCLSLRVCMF